VTNPLEERNSSSQWEVQSCSEGALVFFLLSFGFRVGRLEGRFFFSSCIWCGEWTIHCPLGHWTFHAKFIGGNGGEGGGFYFFSTNRKGQGALLLFLLS
jgi:hypothetical protein